MHVRFHFDVESERHPLPRRHNRIARRRLKLELLTFHFAPCRLRLHAKLTHQNIGGSVALAIAVFEIFRRDYSLRVQHEGSGIGNSEKWTVLRHCFVQNS